MRRIEEAMGDRGTRHIQPHSDLQHEHHHTSFRWPFGRSRARFDFYREYSSGRIQFRSNGTCTFNFLIVFFT